MIEAYVKYVVSLAVALGADPTLAKVDVDNLLDFEIELSNVSYHTQYRIILVMARHMLF